MFSKGRKDQHPRPLTHPSLYCPHTTIAPFSSHPPEKSSQRWPLWSLWILRVCVCSLAGVFTEPGGGGRCRVGPAFKSRVASPSLSLHCAVGVPASKAVLLGTVPGQPPQQPMSPVALVRPASPLVSGCLPLSMVPRTSPSGYCC